jgi:hypothetical protein
MMKRSLTFLDGIGSVGALLAAIAAPAQRFPDGFE